MKRLILAFVTSLIMAVPSSSLAEPIVEAVPTLRVIARHVEPNTRYGVTVYAYHYEGDPFPYTLGYDNGFSSNALGTYRADIPVEYLAQHYNGGEGPVYEAQACLLGIPGYAKLGC